MLIHNALLASPPLQYIVLLHQMLEKFDNRKQSRSVKWITFIFWNRNRKWKWKTWCSPAHPSISLCVRHVKSHRKNRIQNDVVNCCRHCCFNMEIFRGFVICSIDGSLEAEEQNRLFGLINQSLDQFAESCTICAENHDLVLWKYDFTQNLSSFTTILLYFVSSSTKIYGIVYTRKNIWVFYIFLFSVVRFVVFFVFFSLFFLLIFDTCQIDSVHTTICILNIFFLEFQIKILEMLSLLSRWQLVDDICSTIGIASVWSWSVCVWYGICTSRYSILIVVQRSRRKKN